MMDRLKKVFNLKSFEENQGEKRGNITDALDKKVKDYDKIKAEFPEVDFEKLDRLKIELKANKADLEKIRPKFDEEYEKTRNFKGKYARIQRKLNSNIKELEKKIIEAKKEVANDPNNPFEDPVKQVEEKYKYITEVEQAKVMIKRMIQNIDQAMYYGGQLNKLKIKWGDPQTLFTGLGNVKGSVVHVLNYQLPNSNYEDYERELKEAKLKVIEMKKAKKAELELDEIYSLDD